MPSRPAAVAEPVRKQFTERECELACTAFQKALIRAGVISEKDQRDYKASRGCSGDAIINEAYSDLMTLHGEAGTIVRGGHPCNRRQFRHILKLYFEQWLKLGRCLRKSRLTAVSLSEEDESQLVDELCQPIDTGSSYEYFGCIEDACRAKPVVRALAHVPGVNGSRSETQFQGLGEHC